MLSELLNFPRDFSTAAVASLLKQTIMFVIWGFINKTDLPRSTITTVQLKAKQIFFSIKLKDAILLKS